MVAADPLYLTNQHSDLMSDVVKNYTPEYQNRLRVYEITIDQLTAKLPLKQFSFVLAWEILNFATYDELLAVLTQAYYLLRPGGALMFSYNNCDIDTSAHLFEIQAMSFAQQSKLAKDIKKIGFELIAFQNHSTNHPLYTHVSWCELRKHGVLSTVKAHQAMGRILGK
jgi:SAM-dependent methyltransferase